MTRANDIARFKRRIEQLESNQRINKRDLKEAKRLLAELEAKPPLPEPTLPAIEFYKNYEKGGSGKTYRYGAIKADGKWYLTGNWSPQGLTWDQLRDFIEKDNQLATGYYMRTGPLTDVFV